MQRLRLLLDENTLQLLFSHAVSQKGSAAVIAAYGCIGKQPVYAFSQDATVACGALDAAQAAVLHRLFLLAGETGCPIVGIYDAPGAALDDQSAQPLAAYSLLLQAAARLRGTVPVISVLVGNCAGCGLMAACQADIVIAAEPAVLCFSPHHTCTAEEAARHGLVHCLCPHEDGAFQRARACIRMLPVNNLSGCKRSDYVAPDHPASVTLSDAVQSVADRGSLLQLGKHCVPEVYTAFSTICGHTAGIAGIRTTTLRADGCRKLLRLVQICHAFSMPLVLFLEHAGFAAETAADLHAAAQLSAALAELSAPMITVVLQEVQGALFSVAACADLLFACTDAVIAPLAPEAAVEFFWHDKLYGAKNLSAHRAALAVQYRTHAASAETAATLGYADELLTPQQLRQQLSSALHLLQGKRPTTVFPKKRRPFVL